MLYHQMNSHIIDTDPSDGYLQLDVYDLTYFNGGSLTTLDLSGNGDIEEILTPTYGHIHGVGHFPSPGPSWTVMPTPKLNYPGSLADGDAIYACPGGTIEDYNAPAGSNIFKSSVTITFGLPNACGSTNSDFWNTLRQPFMAPQTVAFTSIINGAPGSVTFSWLPATDAYPADNLTGYIILRNTSNSFLATPADGSTYSLGAIIGGATIVANITGSTTTTFTDNTVMNGNVYYYRVYAYRFNIDNLNGDNFNASRGRAYNDNNFVSVNWPGSNPLPVELLFFRGEPKETKVHLTWATTSEKENDYFIIEKSLDGKTFSFLGKVKGAGTSNSILNYSLDDLNPGPDVNYYSLTQVDFNGTQTKKQIIAVRFKATNSYTVDIFPNPFSSDVQIQCLSYGSGPIEIMLYDCLGKAVLQDSKVLRDGANNFLLSTAELASGTYFLVLKNDLGETVHSRIVKR